MTRFRSADDAIREAFLVAMANEVADSGLAPLPHRIVFRAIKDAMATLYRLPDREAGWLYSQRSLWPEFEVDRKDKLDAYAHTVEQIREGSLPDDALVARRWPSPREVTRMEEILGFSALLVGTQRQIDWKIICQVAIGTKPAAIGRAIGRSRTAVYDRIHLQCSAIAKKLKVLLPSEAQIMQEVERRTGASLNRYCAEVA